MNELVKEYEIASYECDENIDFRLRSLFNIFQDVADNHADLMGVGYHYCIQNKLGWVGGAYDVEFFSLPRWNDKVQLKTWPSQTNAATAYREFELKNLKTGQVMISASSQWVLLDLERMRPVPVGKHLEKCVLNEKRAVETRFEKLPGIERIDFQTEEIIRTDDIDLNHHVNNAVYPTWVFDALPADFIENKVLHRLRIHYRQPARRGDKVIIATQIVSETETRHTISDGAGKEYARLHLSWGK